MKAIIILVFLAFLTSVVGGQSRTQNFDSLFTYLKHQNNFNGNVLIAEHGKIVYKKSFGYSNFETKKLLNDKSMFEIASLSKQFTAVGILMLMEQGKLDLSDKLQKYFPSLPYENVTIKNLLTHTSGLPDFMSLFDKHWDKSKIASNADVITLLSEYEPPKLFNAGEQYEYSNTGYVLLGSIIEKVSGEAFGSFMKKNIFAPLKMKRTAVYHRRMSTDKIRSNYAIGYAFNKTLSQPALPDSLNEWRFVFYLDGVFGDGSISSSTADLLKWDRALYDNKLIKQVTLKEAYTPYKLVDGSLSNYGYGWELGFNSTTDKYVFHAGHWPGYGAYINRFIDKDKTIIVLRNMINYSKRANGIPNVYMDILFNKPFDLPRIEIR